jgi:hypothetical protein
VPDGLTSTNRLLQPLRHRPFAAPAIAIRATVAASFRRGRECGGKIIRADPEVIHAVAEIGNHAVSLAFVHETCFLLNRYPVFFSTACDNARQVTPLVAFYGVRLFARAEDDVD